MCATQDDEHGGSFLPRGTTRSVCYYPSPAHLHRGSEALNAEFMRDRVINFHHLLQLPPADIAEANRRILKLLDPELREEGGFQAICS